MYQLLYVGGKKVAYFKEPLLFTIKTTQAPAGHWKIHVYALQILTMHLSSDHQM